jgi:hypothetical protein
MLGFSRWSLASLASLSLFACGGLVDLDESEAPVGGGTNPPLSTIEPPSAGVGGSEGPPELEPENVDCTGDFGEPEVLFEDVGWIPQALSTTRDGLEFFYARLALDDSIDDSGQRRFAVRMRESQENEFSDPIPLVELDDACALAEPGTQPSALDVSGDALRLYIGCNSLAGPPYEQGPLLLATRADKHSPFVVQEEPIGVAGISLGLTKDELEGFGSSLDPAVPEIIHYTRPSIDVPFDSGVSILGGVEMLNPEPAPDGLYLLGVVGDVTPGVNQIGFSMRRQNGAAFSAPSTEGMPPPGVNTDDYSPALTSNCREIYFLRTHSPPDFHGEVMVSRR